MPISPSGSSHDLIISFPSSVMNISFSLWIQQLPKFKAWAASIIFSSTQVPSSIAVWAFEGAKPIHKWEHRKRIWFGSNYCRIHCSQFFALLFILHSYDKRTLAPSCWRCVSSCFKYGIQFHARNLSVLKFTTTASRLNNLQKSCSILFRVKVRCKSRYILH